MNSVYRCILYSLTLLLNDITPHMRATTVTPDRAHNYALLLYMQFKVVGKVQATKSNATNNYQCI